MGPTGRMGKQQIESAAFSNQEACFFALSDVGLINQSGGKLLLLVQCQEVPAGHKIPRKIEMAEGRTFADGPFLFRNPLANRKEDVFDAISAVFLPDSCHASLP